MGAREKQAEARIESERADCEHERQRQEYERQHHETEKLKGGMRTRMRRASVEDYRRWLIGYLENDGKITHVYDYQFGSWEWYIASDGLVVYPLYGVQSVNIIVPEGVEIEVKGTSHNAIYYMDGFKKNDCIVPDFSDIKF